MSSSDTKFKGINIEELKATHQQLVDDVAHISRSVDEIIKKFDQAFPSADIDGHRRYHEAMIEDIEARKRLTQAIKEKTISGLIWAAIVAAATAGWRLLGR